MAAMKKNSTEEDHNTQTHTLKSHERLKRPHANIIDCTYTNLEIITYYTPTLYIVYKPVHHFTVLNAIGNSNTMVSIIIIYYNILGPLSYMGCVVDRKIVIRRKIVLKLDGQ
jgi:hypothetical protein